MRLFFQVTSVVASTLAVVIIAFALYESTGELRELKRAIFGVREDYRKLEQAYETYREKTRNLRKVSVLTNPFVQSNNVQVGTIIAKHAREIQGELSIVYKNLSSGESVLIDEEKPYYMASLYKVILTLYLLEEVRLGHMKLTDAIGSPPIPLEEALNKIITESNNEYAITLAQTYGWDTIEKAMKAKLGIEFSFEEDLEINATNVGILFEDIVLSLKISDGESEYLLKLLNEQQHTQKLPKYLPKNVISHNKTGEFEGYSHDAAIFYTPKANYILIFMSNTPNPAATEEQMALMSKEVYEALNN